MLALPHRSCGDYAIVTRSFSQPIEKKAAKVIKEKQRFERLVLTKEEVCCPRPTAAGVIGV